MYEMQSQKIESERQGLEMCPYGHMKRSDIHVNNKKLGVK